MYWHSDGGPQLVWQLPRFNLQNADCVQCPILVAILACNAILHTEYTNLHLHWMTEGESNAEGESTEVQLGVEI